MTADRASPPKGHLIRTRKVDEAQDDLHSIFQYSYLEANTVLIGTRRDDETRNCARRVPPCC